MTLNKGDLLDWRCESEHPYAQLIWGGNDIHNKFMVIEQETAPLGMVGKSKKYCFYNMDGMVIPRRYIKAYKVMDMMTGESSNLLLPNNTGEFRYSYEGETPDVCKYAVEA
jgi:hypothetical protein